MYWHWRRLALLVEILTTKFCPSAVVPALQSIWLYNTWSNVWYDLFLTNNYSLRGLLHPNVVSRKCAHPLHGNRTGKPERRATLEMGKEIMSKWNTFVPVGTGKGGKYTLVYRVLKFHDAPLIETWSRDRSEEGVGVGSKQSFTGEVAILRSEWWFIKKERFNLWRSLLCRQSLGSSSNLPPPTTGRRNNVCTGGYV